MKHLKQFISLILAAVITASLFIPTAFAASDNDTASFKDHTYRRIDESMTWKQAKEYCENLGGYLATITSSQEQEVVKELVRKGTKAQYWLGATDEATVNKWKWVTGEDFSYLGPTVSFETNDNGEYYLQMQRHNWGNESYLGYWNNANNENHINGEESFYSTGMIGFICEFGASPLPAEKNAPKPIIYIIGRTGIYTSDGRPTITESTDYITDVIKDSIPDLVIANITNRWDKYSDKIYNAVASRYATYRLSNDGEITNGSHELFTWDKNTIFGFQADIFSYKFEYDARKDPCEVADDLHEYIEAVKEATGYDSFHLISRCLGCNIAAAYLAKYGWDDIETNVMYASAAKGYDFVGEIFSGKFDFNPSAIARFTEETFNNDNPDISALVKALIAYYDQINLLDLGTFAAQKTFDRVKKQIVPRLILATYGTCPGYWAMVNDENYEQAKKFIFGSEAGTTYKKLVEKIDNYHYNVQNKLEDMLIKMKKDGVKINVICKYGYQVFPFIESSDAVGDNRIEVSMQSFGATTSKINSTFSPSYLLKKTAAGEIKYISPDCQIDSSTALFPDYTWYIKNNEHNPFFDCFNPLLFKMCYSEKQMTVNSDREWPQYLIYNGDGTCAPLTVSNMNTIHYTSNPIEAMFNLFKCLFVLNLHQIQNLIPGFLR